MLVRRASSRRGFTLVELLVVIAVIALLIGLLLPVLGRARDGAKAARCLANHRSLGQATLAYTIDNQQFLPQPTQSTGLNARQAGTSLWYNAVDYYLGLSSKNYTSAIGAADERNYEEFKQDPSWFSLEDDHPDPDVRDRRNTHTIKMNRNLGGSGGSFVRLTDPGLAAPSRTVLYVDGRGHDTPSVTTGRTVGAGNFFATPGLVGLRHDDAANIGFLDGAAGHQSNPINQNSNGYRGWFAEGSAAPDELPDAIFDFRSRQR